MTPPSIDKPAAGELWNLGKLGLSFRGLGKKDAYRLLRWGPMAVADLVAEWFETELLRATVAARGIFGAFAGPWSAGTSTGSAVASGDGWSCDRPVCFRQRRDGRADCRRWRKPREMRVWRSELGATVEQNRS